MELKDLIFTLVTDQPGINGDAQKAINFLCEFAAKPDAEREQILTDYKAQKADELQATKDALPAQRIAQDKQIDDQIASVGDLAVSFAVQENPTKPSSPA